MSRPSFLLCLVLWLLKRTTILYAWVFVPIGFLVGGIRKGELSYTQWAGLPYKGHVVTIEKAPRIECRGWWRVFDLPDEPSVGQYEPSVRYALERFGWYVAVWYQLAWRNVGHGWPFLWAQAPEAATMANGHPLTPSETLRKKFGLWYGLRPYADWRASAEALLSNDPLPKLKWYYVPFLGLRVDWAGVD